METQNKAEMDDIMSSFRQLQEKSAVNTKSFRVASMNEYLEKAKLLPPLVVLYPNIVLEGDLCRICSVKGYPDSGSNRDALRHWCLRPARLPIPPSGHAHKDTQ